MPLIIDDHEYKAVLYKSNHGKQYAPMRYCIIDITTGEIVDDAQGYGYTSAQKAYSGFSYRRTHHPSGKKNRSKKKKRDAIQRWLDSHRFLVRTMEDYAFHCAKGSMGPDDKLDENAVKAFIEDMAPDCPYTAKEILKAFLS